MKYVVFLDIDGVLNSPKNYSDWRIRHEEAKTGYDIWLPSDDDPFIMLLFEPSCVSVLNEITEKLRAQIVVSSSWRLFYARDFDRLRGILQSAGVKAPIIEATPTIIPDRGTAISSWLLGTHERSLGVLILDDEPSFTFGRERDWHLHVDGNTGLVDKDAWTAELITAKPWTPGETA